MGTFKDLTGMVFGRLLVVSLDRTGKRLRWKCLCSCGNSCLVQSTHLINSHTKSCGCLQKETVSVTGKNNTDHGQCTSKELQALYKAIGRCHNPFNESYADYGGRGVTVCSEWRDKPSTFLEDMGPAPSKAFCLDRIDNAGNYCKDNCRWTTYRIQNHNRRKIKGCTSKFIGVCWSKSCSKWEAKIRTDSGIQEHLGYFNIEDEAAKAYDSASKILFGDEPNSYLLKNG